MVQNFTSLKMSGKVICSFTVVHSFALSCKITIIATVH